MEAEQTLQEALQQAQRRGTAILATNFYNFETLQGLLRAAAQLKAPIILQLTQSSIAYMGLQMAVAMARAGLAQHKVKGWVHLDHAPELELVASCLEAGFDSVMIDGSESSLEENIRLTRAAVALARKTGANVEAELGFVAKLGQEADPQGMTDPAEAAHFVEETGVDALAVSIGTAHGFYKAEPVLDMERLTAIRKLTRIPLVLHGGSGISEAQIREATRRGICKVNVATETKNAFVRGVKRELANSQDIDLRTVFPPAIQDVTSLIRGKLCMVTGEAPHA